MEISSLLAGLLILFIVFFIVVGLYFRTGPPVTPPINPNTFTDQYNDFTFWGPEQAVSGARGNCSLYEFPAHLSSTLYPCEPFALPFGVPGLVSLEVSVLDALTPLPQPNCADLDQIVARKVTRTCMGLHPGTLSQCVSPDGTRYNVGQTETIYTQDECGMSQCTSSLALIGIGYSVVNVPPACNNIRCLLSHTDNTVTGTQCNISNLNEIYRVSRFDVSGKANPVGLLAQIQDRGTGLCVVPNGNITALVLAPCGNPGWALLPVLKGMTTTSEQQIAWFGNLDGFQIEDIFNSTSVDQVISKIVGYGVKSIQLTVTDQVTLLPFAFYANIMPDPDRIRRATGQVIDYTLYNTILYTQTPFVF